jgi:hypothetical protein
VNEFAVGVVSSIFASVLLVSAGWLRSHGGRAWLVRRLSALTGLGVDRTYGEQRLAADDLAADLARARWIKVQAGRGNELTRDTFRGVWSSGGGRLESIEVLLPNPAPGDGWLHLREGEIARHDPGYEPGLLGEQIHANIRYLTAVAADRPELALRLFDLPHTHRLVITDDVAYVTTYPAHQHGRNAPCFVFRSDSPFYDHALRLFTTAWQASTAALQTSSGHVDYRGVPVPTEPNSQLTTRATTASVTSTTMRPATTALTQ